MIHLDTSFLIIHALVRPSRADKRLRKWLRDGDGLAISSIAWEEFLCGP
jgi:predicted nucleic acid-binding protein